MPKLIDLTGKKFGKLIVIERDYSSKRTKWICKCKCGKIKSIQAGHLMSGSTTSCGCYQKEKAREANKVHGFTKTSLHNRWKSIKQRCLNPNSQRYKDYGARGITICEEWLDFEKFHEWAIKNGYEENLTLDREDNDRGYCPDNCRWVDYKTNERNRRITVKIEDMTLGEIAEKNGFEYKTIVSRYFELLNSKQEITIDKLVRRYKLRKDAVIIEGLTLKEISSKYNISIYVLRHRIRKLGIPNNEIKIYMLIPSQANEKSLERRRD
ncbi:hypothetical protein CBB2_2563 [Clostridium botulinum]|uniref:hypothetical protein n=1 Tax=Clostridium botulinum TaxID=1491 RepID=UPI000581CC87|nr:hypothetical protein [Clostridium botulinum]BAQ14673.1 hypothetical protein CBB2_2563 [Clostridium botulinum]